MGASDKEPSKQIALTARITRLEQHRQQLEAEWKAIPKLFFFALLALPVGFFYGVPFAALTIGFTVALAITAAYLRGVKLADCKQEITVLERELRRLS